MTAEPENLALARRTLTDVQFLTWLMAERGLSQRAIAYYRRVSPSTVRDCLEACDLRMAKAIREVTDD